jgi:hypothetical protein
MIGIEKTVFARFKHTSLLRPRVKCTAEKLYNITYRTAVYKQFTACMCDIQVTMS